MPATLSIFSRFIEALSVPHTSNYTEEIYQENPYKHTLYGLSILLKKYKVDNFAIRVDDKHELMKGGVPFIAEVSDDLVIVTSINKAQVKYDWYGEIVTKSLEWFYSLRLMKHLKNQIMKNIVNYRTCKKVCAMPFCFQL